MGGFLKRLSHEEKNRFFKMPESGGRDFFFLTNFKNLKKNLKALQYLKAFICRGERLSLREGRG